MLVYTLWGSWYYCGVGEANMLVYTLWASWAECNVCGKANGERRRTGSITSHTLTARNLVRFRGGNWC